MAKINSRMVSTFFLISILMISIYLPLFHLKKLQYNQSNQSYQANDFKLIKTENNFADIYFKKDPNFLPMKILTVIGGDESSYFNKFLYLSSIPISIYKFQNKTFLMPQIYGKQTSYKSYFLEDWKQYCDKWGGIDEILYLGNVTDQEINYYNTLSGITGSDNTIFNSTDLFNITSSIARFFWYKPDTVILAFANMTFQGPYKTTINENNSLNANSYQNIINEWTINDTTNVYSSLNISLDTGAYYFTINDSNSFIMKLMGNTTDGKNWVYDTNLDTYNKWVFFPKVKYPGNMSEWKLEIVNRSKLSNIKYKIVVSNISYYEKPIVISDNYKTVNINLTWTPKSNEDLDLWVISPRGQLIKGPVIPSFYQNPVMNESISLHYPETGSWKILVTGNQNQTIPFNISIEMEKENNYLLNCIESSSNGAVLSSLLNYPMLYLNNNSVPNSTIDAIKYFGANKSIILSPRQKIPTKIYNELKNAGITYFENLTTESKIINKIKSISSEPDFVITSSSNGNFAPASYLAAFHGAPIILSDNKTYNIHQKSQDTYSQLEKTVLQNPFGRGTINQSVPIFEDMVNLSDTFYNWLTAMNASYPEKKTIIIVEPLDELSPTFDRAILGKSLVGRFGSKSSDENSILIMNNIYYPILSFLNLTKEYVPSTLNLPPEQNSTITQINLTARNFSNTINAVRYNDSIYHSYSNFPNGSIIMAYALNLSNYNIAIDNITSINITVIAKLNYSDASIIKAGWAIYNWSLNDIQYINTTIFNSTTDKSDYYNIPASQIHNFLNKNQHNRSELFFIINVSYGNVSLEVNYINYQINYQRLINRPNSLSSSLNYYHNFSINNNFYNFSEYIPQNLSKYNFYNENHTGSNEIINLLNNIGFWYYSGAIKFDNIPYSDNSSILFTNVDGWRGYNNGGNPNDPDPTHQNFIFPSVGLQDWKSNQYIDSNLNNIHSKFILMQSSFAGSTKIPQTLLLHGATNIICNIRANSPGYSEFLIYDAIQNLLKYQNYTIGQALLSGINKTSHMYSFNWKQNITELSGFSNTTEDSLQYILFGDPENILINQNMTEIMPGNYRPLVHAFLNYSYRDNIYIRQTKPFGPYLDGNGQLWASITDFDSNPIIYINLTNTDLGANPLAEFYYQHHYIPCYKKSGGNELHIYGTTFNYRAITIFDRHWTPGFTRESLGWKNAVWGIYDQDVNFSVHSSFYLRSNPPFLNYFGPLSNTTRFLLNTTGINDTTTFENISHQTGNLHENIWRVNNTFWVRIKAIKTDQDPLKHVNNELNVTLLISQNFSLPLENWSKITMHNETQPSPYNPYQAEYGIWNASFNFKGNKTGKYWFAIILEDEWGEKTYYKDYDDWYFYVNNWLPEFNYKIPSPTKLNATQIHRVNETLEINVSVFDRDGYPGVKNVSFLLNNSYGEQICFPMSDISSVGLNWSSNYTFSQFNRSGEWNLYFIVVDYDNASRTLNSSIIINVSNWAPEHPYNLSVLNLSTHLSQSYLYRNHSLLLLANATDIDIANRTSLLKLYAFIRAPNKTIYKMLMNYSKNYSLWIVNFTPAIDFITGNYTYFVGVIDEVGAMSNSTETINISVINNKPIINQIQVCVGVDRLPSNQLNVGIDLVIKGNVSDVEGLQNITVVIEDNFGNSINLTQILSGHFSNIQLVFNDSFYSNLEIHKVNDWKIYITLYDNDGVKTINFNLNGEKLNETTIHIIPYNPPITYKFPYALIIAIAIIMIAVIATYLVYKNIHERKVIVPAQDIKRIIKQISQEEKGKEEEEEEIKPEEKEKIEAIRPKEEVPVKLSLEEIEEIQNSIKDNLKTIKIAIEKEQFKRVAELYRYIANLSVNINKHHMASVFLDKAKEYDELDKLSPKKKKTWKKPKKEVEEEIIAKPGELTQEQFEEINLEIGSIIRKAREALRNNELESAIELYQYASKLALRINNRRKANIFSKRAKEIMRKLEEE